jgi:tetratricopeptide (TPR) repeat protein
MLAVLIAVAMATEVAASPEQVLALLDGQKYSDALREGKLAVELQPKSARAHFAYGVVLRAVFRRAEAALELERARTLAPDDGEVTVELGWVLAETGKLERARGLAAAALTRWPDLAADLDAWLDREQRIKNGPTEAFPAGSPSAFVAGVMRKLADHKIAEVLRDDFDRSFMDRWAAESMVSSSSTEEYIAGLAGELEEVMDRQSHGASLHGYEVAAEPAVRDGRTYVTVALLIDSRPNPTQLEMFEKAAADPSLPVPMDENLARVLRGLDPADRKASLAALGAQTSSSDLAIEFELSGREGGWKITDVIETAGGMRLSGIMKTIRTLVDRGVVKQPRQRSRAYQIGEAVGRVLGGLLVAALVIALVRRARRRRS